VRNFLFSCYFLYDIPFPRALFARLLPVCLCMLVSRGKFDFMLHGQAFQSQLAAAQVCVSKLKL
jgi:hypothetical protein